MRFSIRSQVGVSLRELPFSRGGKFAAVSHGAKALIFSSLKAGKVARIDFSADDSAIHGSLGLPAALVLLRDLIGATLASPVGRCVRCSWLCCSLTPLQAH